MSVPPSYYRPALKASVDVQLQTAFSDGNWPTVIRLASRRAAALKDPYYEAVKLCAESQLEDPAERVGVLVALDAQARNGSAVPDYDTLELYEWACRDIQPPVNYSETIGVLRARWVKANPKSAAGIDCLSACVHQWDLVNAQQIAAALDKGHPKTSDRRFMFWNITLTYLLSTSPQCPEGKAAIYGMLASKQLIKAAETAESGDGAERGLQEEEEINLFYSVLRDRNEWDAFAKAVRSPKSGALRHFSEGRKHPFLQAIDALESRGEWDTVYDFCKEALGKTDEDGSPSLLAADWRVWKSFIGAASKRPDVESALQEVQTLLERFTSMTSKVAVMYKKNLAVALLELTFRVPRGLQPPGMDQSRPSPRVLQLCMFLDQNATKPSAFDDVKHYLEQLTTPEATCLLTVMLPRLAEGDDRLKRLSLRVIEHKVRYFLSTCAPTDYIAPTDDEAHLSPFRCVFCGAALAGSCNKCLEDLASSSLSTYRSIEDDAELLEAIGKLDKDPRIDLALVSAMSLLKLAGLGRAGATGSFLLASLRASRVLQAVLILDAQLSRSPKEVPLRLLLVRLYLVLGCASLAYQLWIPLDVKRTILDALGPLFFDRLSSLSPALVVGDRRPLMEPVLSYYSASLRSKAPVRVWDAFSGGSYSAILDMATYADRLQRSSMLVTAIVEERRAARAVGGKMDSPVEDVPLLSHVREDAVFVNATDYGSLPNLESSRGPQLYDLIKLGPALSNERTHLNLLVERYIDLVTFKPPKDYKAAKTSGADDKDYVVEALGRIHSSMSTVLDSRGVPSKLTPAEEKHFNAVAILAALLLAGLTTPRADQLPAAFSLYGSSVRAALSSLRASALAPPPSSLPASDVLYTLTNQPGLSALRDTALAAKQTAAFLQSCNEKELARDRSGKSGLHKDVLAEAKGLDALATKMLAEVRGRFKTLKESLAQGGWLDRMSEWAFDAESGKDALGEAVLGVVGRPALEDWAGRVVESWREGVKGWGTVKME